MAEAVKKSAGRPKKVEEPIVENNDTNKLKEENSAMAEMLKQMQEQMAQLQAQVEASKSNVVIAQPEKTLNGKKVKCINMMNNPLNVSTEPDGQGRVFSFDKYGDSRLIKFDDLADIVASYPNTIEKGLLLIANKEAVAELGLEDDYGDIITKDAMDELVYLRRASDVDLFICMSPELQKSTATKIAELLNANESMDFNYLRKIKDVTGFDIEEIAKELKEFDVKM